jgi:hypothetical protein
MNFSVMVGFLAAVAGVSPLDCRRISADFHNRFGSEAMTHATNLDAIEWFANAIAKAKGT